MKQGQMEVTFHWIYLVIAGAVILLFFAGIVVKQQSIAEEELAADVVGILDTIFTGAGVSEKTKNTIDTSGLADMTLEFSCENGVSSFGVEGRQIGIDNVIDPLFAPQSLQTPQLVTWSLPYVNPFKVMDILMVTAPTVKYYVWGSSDVVNEFADEMEDIGTVGYIVDQGEYQRLLAESYHHLRIIDAGGNIRAGMAVPLKFRDLHDEQVSAVQVVLPFVQYYQKQGSSFVEQGSVELLSMGGERDALAFAAMIAADPDMMKCNMQKVLRRMELVSQMYLARAWELKEYYNTINPRGDCSTTLGDEGSGTISQLITVIDYLNTCKQSQSLCPVSDIRNIINLLHQSNDNLRLNCIPLY